MKISEFTKILKKHIDKENYFEVAVHLLSFFENISENITDENSTKKIKNELENFCDKTLTELTASVKKEIFKKKLLKIIDNINIKYSQDIQDIQEQKLTEGVSKIKEDGKISLTIKASSKEASIILTGENSRFAIKIVGYISIVVIAVLLIILCVIFCTKYENDCEQLDSLMTNTEKLEKNLINEIESINNKINNNDKKRSTSINKVDSLKKERRKITKKRDNVSSVIIPLIKLTVDSCQQYTQNEINKKIELIKSEISKLNN